MAKHGRGKKLSVLNLLLGLAVRSVIFIILPAQAVQAAVTRIQVIDVIAADPIVPGFAAVNKIQQFFIRFLPLVLRYNGIINRILHLITSISRQAPETRTQTGWHNPCS